MLTRRVPLIVLSTLLTTGCSGLVVRGVLPRDSQRIDLGPSDAGTPFAIDPAAERLAVVRGQLIVEELATGKITPLGGVPLALSWSPDGSRLAASFPQAQRGQAESGQAASSVLKLFDVHGAVLAQSPVKGRLTSLSWSSCAEVLGTTATLETYSFGSNREEALVRWDGQGPVRTEPLGSVTLKRTTVQQYATVLTRGPALAIAPQGDVIAWAGVHDPPMYAPFSSLEARHLDGKKVHELGRVPPGAEGLAWAPDGESIWLSGPGAVVRWDCWRSKQVASLVTAGRNLAVAPRGDWVFADGKVFREGAEVVAFAPDSEGIFTARGLLLRTRGRLVLVERFAASPPPEAHAHADAHANAQVDDKAREHVLQLRKLRAEGLMTADEFDALSAPKAPDAPTTKGSP